MIRVELGVQQRVLRVYATAVFAVVDVEVRDCSVTHRSVRRAAPRGVVRRVVHRFVSVALEALVSRPVAVVTAVGVLVGLVQV